MTLKTTLAQTYAEAFNASVLHEMVSWADCAAETLKQRAKEIGTEQLQEAKAHMSDATDFNQLAYYLRQMLVETNSERN